jgi:disulfide bond formation protein DsbB
MPPSNPGVAGSLHRIWPGQAPALLLLASAGALIAVFVAQHGFGLEPCVLCLYQRWPYAAVILFMGLAVALPAQRARLLLLAALAFAVGGGIGVYHVGAEQHWWAGTEACSGGGAAQSVEELRRQLLGRKPARCDEVAFSFLGLSLAGWNVVLSSVLAGLSLAAWRRA